MSSGNKKLPFYKSTTFKVILGLLCLDSILVSSIVVMMNTTGTKLVGEESARLIEQTGNNVVTSVSTLLNKYEVLARSLANAAGKFPKDQELLKKVMVDIVDFNHDNVVAGGGIWFQPKKFETETVRRSFFWGRDAKNVLQFFDDYNAPGIEYDEMKFNSDASFKENFLKAPGYHNEEWYVVAEHLKDTDKGFWSRSYLDPYSFEPMVTITVAIRGENNDFLGVSTVDLRLSGLHKLFEDWSKKTGGYIFVTDRNGKFLTYPKPELAKIYNKKPDGTKTEEFMSISDFAGKIDLFKPIESHLKKINDDVIKNARNSKNWNTALVDLIDRSSYQIDRTEAEFVNSVIVDPMKEKTTSSYLVDQFNLATDNLLNVPVRASIFHVPGSYWKITVIKPETEYVAVAQTIKETLLRMIFIIVACIFTIACFYQIHFVVRPLTLITRKVLTIREELMSGKYIQELTDKKVTSVTSGEVAQLAEAFNDLTNSLDVAEQTLRRRLGALLGGTREMGSSRNVDGAISVAARTASDEFVGADKESEVYLVKGQNYFQFHTDGEDISRVKAKSSLSLNLPKENDFVGLIDGYICFNYRTGSDHESIVINAHGMSKLTREDLSFLRALVSSLEISIDSISYLNNVEEMVRQRTAELVSKNRDIQAMLHNIPQGIFTITREGRIHEEYSSHLEGILETKIIASQKFNDLILNQLELGTDDRNMIETSLGNILGEDEMAFDMNGHHLPKEKTFKASSGSHKILTFDWAGIINSADEVEKILCSVRDVTTLRALEKESEEKGREIEIIRQIIKISRAGMTKFIAETRASLEVCVKKVKEITKPNLDDVALMFRHLHTLKGNARSLGLSLITDQIHNAEEVYDNIRRSKDFSTWKKTELLADLQAVRDKLDIYKDMFENRLGGKSDGANRDEFFITELSTILEKAEQPEKVSLQEVRTAMEHHFNPKFEEELAGLNDMAASIATEIKKREPLIKIIHGETRIPLTYSKIIRDSFGHIIRNSLDHGLEDTETRKKADKDPRGTITIEVNNAKGGGYSISVWDDGRGLNLTKIAEKGLAKSLISANASDAEIADLCFKSGLSSRDEVTTLSGRGVGLDAVREMFSSFSGSAAIEFMGPRNENYQQFKLVLSLPPSNKTLGKVKPVMLKAAN